METDDVSVREQLFHNRVRETIVSNAGLELAVGWNVSGHWSPTIKPRSHSLSKLGIFSNTSFLLNYRGKVLFNVVTVPATELVGLTKILINTCFIIVQFAANKRLTLYALKKYPFCA